MGGSNLPPGVTESMIPGNRPEDVAFDAIIDGPLGEFLYNNAELVAQVQEELVRRLDLIMSDFWFCEICGKHVEAGKSTCSRNCALMLEDIQRDETEE